MAIISSHPTIALVKTRWRNKGPRTVAERAGVIGSNLWKLSLEIFKHMEKEGFRFGSDRLVTGVLTEFIAFVVQLVDRAAYGKLSDADRAALIGEVAGHLAATMENNQRDLLGPGEYRKPFIDALNTRFEEYAEYECPAGEPGYPCLRFFATKVADAMAGADNSGDNKWVVEQMMDIEAPAMVRLVKKLVDQTVSAGAGTAPR